MFRKNRTVQFLILTVILIISGCASSNKVNHKNLAHLYEQEGVVLKPMFYVYKTNPNEIELTFQASSDQLLYKINEEELFIANYSLHYELYESYELESVMDSGTFIFTDQKKSLETKILLKEVDIALNNIFTETPVVKVVLTDLNRKLKYHNFLAINLKDDQNRQNFKMKTSSGRIRFMNHIMANEPFLIENNANASAYYVRQYNREFPLATPPFIESKDMQFKYEADRKFMVEANDTFKFEEPGFYHFQLHEDSKEGFTVYIFDNAYPFINHRELLAEPLRYLTSQAEFDIIMNQNTPDSIKYQVDKFWLKSGGSIERSKELVRIYYNRIQDANLYFGSYLEGWKTDRGITYAILGPPTKVTKDLNTETWVYGNENSALNMVFTFVKVYNPFSDNDFALAKLNRYRYPWGQAIDAWRHGTAYGIKEIIREQDERDQQLRMANPAYSWN